MSLGFHSMRPYLAMIALQFGYAGMSIITLVSLKGGFSHWVLVVYRHVVATLVFSPFAYFLEKETRPKMTMSVFLKIALLAFLEPVLNQNMYYVGLRYTSATFASATVNVLPAITFILAVIFRMEKINMKKTHSQAKVIGTSITVAGAMLITMYKGPIVDILWTPHGGSHHKPVTTEQHWIVGTTLLLTCKVGWAAFFILQNMTLKEYPAELSLTSLVCIMGTVEGGIVAVIMDRNWSSWAIGFDSRLLAVVYSGVVCSGIAFYIQGVVNKARGPVFVTAFSPVSMIVTAILGPIILSEHIYLGSLIGSAIIVVGLFSVVWGKNKECSSSVNVISDTEMQSIDQSVVDENKECSSFRNGSRDPSRVYIHDCEMSSITVKT